jgi:hypothetical protein
MLATLVPLLLAATRPNFWFFSELADEDVESFFANDTTTTALRKLNASVALAMSNLTQPRAAAVRHLQSAGVPVTGWLLLPKSEGYWANANNAPLMKERYSEFHSWVTVNNLKMEAVGLDMEVDQREVQALMEKNWSTLEKDIKADHNMTHLLRARSIYGDLVDAMHTDGYKVQTYIMPPVSPSANSMPGSNLIELLPLQMYDERKVGSTIFQRELGLVDIPRAVDLEIPMLYSTEAGEPVFYSYMRSERNAQRVGTGIGSTGSPQSQTHDTFMTWAELKHDLLASTAYTWEVAVYSLEGMVHQGFLQQLLSLDWNQQLPRPPIAKIDAIDASRAALQDIMRRSCAADPHSCFNHSAPG